MIINPLRLATLAAALSVGALAFAQEVPRGSFIVAPVQSRYQLIEQIRTDPVVSTRYQRHFGMTHDEVVRYVSTLNTSTVEQSRTYTVWYTRPQSQTVYSKRLYLRQGEPVFVDRTGTVVLRLKCGNPLITQTVARRYYDTVVVQQPIETTTVITTEERAQPMVVNSILQPIVTQHNLSWEDAAATYVLSEAMDISPSSVVAMRTSELASTSFIDLAPALLMSWKGQQSLTDVYGRYTGGSTWVDLASQYALPGMYWNNNLVSTNSWTNQDFSNNMWQSLLLNNLYVPSSEVTYFGAQNAPIQQLLVASVLGRQFNLPARDLLTAYAAANNDWATVERNLISNPPVRSYIRIGG